MPRMTGARLFAEMMRDYEVSHIFFVPAFMLKSFAEMEDMPIARVMVHGEKAAGIRDAHMAGSPVIAITGGPAPLSRYKHAYQEVDDITQFDAVTKFNAQVDAVTRLPDLTRQAFRVATSGAPGPVHLRIQGHLGQLTEAEAELDPMIEAKYKRTPPFRSEPDLQHVNEALALLTAAV